MGATNDSADYYFLIFIENSLGIEWYNNVDNEERHACLDAAHKLSEITKSNRSIELISIVENLVISGQYEQLSEVLNRTYEIMSSYNVSEPLSDEVCNEIRDMIQIAALAARVDREKANK